MKYLLFVGAGGFVGSCARYLVTMAMSRALPWFPFGTLLSNIAASLLIGFIIGIERGGSAIDQGLKLLLTTGALGGLSTFSTFSMETVAMLEGGRLAAAGANAALNLGLCLLFVAIGLALAKLMKTG